MSLGWLFEKMAQWRDASAVICRDEHTTYGELLERVEAWRQVLDQAGVPPGAIVAVEGEFSPGTCTLLLALIDRSCIVVPITKAVAAHRNDFLRIAEVERVAVFDDDGAWRFENREIHPSHPMLRKLLDDGAPGLVLFSSGSTGESKAVLSDLDRLLEKFKVQRQRLVTLTFLLFDHIGGFNTLFYAFSNGGAVVTVQSRSPEEICRLIELHQVELLPTTPTFLNLLLLSEAYRSHDLSSLKLITYGTEVMPDSTLQRLHEAFPNVRLQQTYGLTELGILRSKSQDSASAWVKVGGEGIETKVVDGTLWVKAPSAMAGYLNAPSPFDAEGWMNTEDLVEVSGEYVRFLGRKSQIINVGGAKVYPAEVESVLLQMPNVGDATVYGRPNPITGQIVAARLTLREPEDLAALTRRVRTFCREHLAAYKIPVKVELAEVSQVSARFKKIRKL
ncbi:MAG: long-chain fatty acid--CoA ligase [Candidatus Solibacter sp.]